MTALPGSGRLDFAREDHIEWAMLTGKTQYSIPIRALVRIRCQGLPTRVFGQSFLFSNSVPTGEDGS